MVEIISQGAEALIIKENNSVIKDRVKKSYRLKELDEKIRIQRTRHEIKLLEKASKIINSPVPIPNKTKEKKSTKIEIPFIEGLKLSESLDSFDKTEAIFVCKEIGKQIGKLHDNDIIHGDLTTSNMILVENKNDKKVYFIDFGLGFQSHRIEDKAVDLHLIKQALEAKHYKNFKQHWDNIEIGYKTSKNSSKVLEQLRKVESRGRYKEKY